MTRNATLSLLFIVLSFLLTACFRDTITEFENCVPEVTLVSTEATPTIEIIQAGSGWSDFKIEPNEYYACIFKSFECGTSKGGFDFIALPIGTKIKLDGYAAEYYKVLVDTRLFLRGKIDDKTVWVSYIQAQQLADPANEDSFKKLGLIDETGKEVTYNSDWKCPNER